MPRGDRTGPTGQGPGTGRGMGRGVGRGMGQGRGRGQGQGRGRMGGPFSAGPGGNCVCPNCGAAIPHAAGQPCSQINCPECGTKMTRS